MSRHVVNSDIEWVRLQDMAGHMLDAARDGDWEIMIELNEQRQSRLEQYFITIAPTLEPDLRRDRIHVLQAMEQQLLEYSTAMRDDVAKKLKHLQQSKRAEKAYSENAAA